MPRPRQNNPDLPPNVYPKHGRFWYVHRGEWTALSQDREQAINAGKKLNLERGPGWSPELQNALEAAFAGRRRGAKSHGVEFTIDYENVLALVRTHSWCCAVTSIPFSLECPPGKKRAPFAPSLDRIECTQGYVAGNVRVVCLAANFAMNEWGDAVMKTLAEGWLKAEFKRRVLDSPKV